MKKLILPIIVFLIFLSLTKYSYAQDYQTSKDCLEQRHNDEYQCDKIHKSCVEGCSGQYIDKCIGACFDEKHKCYDAVKAEYDKCLNGQQGSQPDQSKQSKASEEANPFNIFGINPFQMWLNLQEVAEAVAFYGTGKLYETTLSIVSHGVGVTPSWERDAKAISVEEAVKRVYEKMAAEKKFVEDAQARYFSLTQEEKNKLAEILNRWDTKIEAKDNPIIINTDSVKLQLQPFNGQPGVLEPEPYWPMLKGGALDVIVEPQDGQQFQMQTPNAEIFVIGTKFSVIYNPKNNQTLVAVYEGKVEIKSKDGKSVNISADSDEPGIALLERKLSPVKLGIVGVSLTAVVGGIALFLKDRQKPSKKR